MNNPVDIIFAIIDNVTCAGIKSKTQPDDRYVFLNKLPIDQELTTALGRPIEPMYAHRVPAHLAASSFEEAVNIAYRYENKEINAIKNELASFTSTKDAVKYVSQLDFSDERGYIAREAIDSFIENED